RVGFEVDGTGGAQAERLSQRLLSSVRSECDADHLTRTELLGHLKRSLDGVTVEVAHVPLESRLVDACAARRDLEAHVHLGDALDTDGNLHRRASLVKDFTRKPRRVAVSSPAAALQRPLR